jgi:ABC-type amino acid transport substrate-binding protein
MPPPPRRRVAPFRAALIVGLAFLGLASCATSPAPPAGPPPLRIGITSTYPPLVFRSGGPVTGLEVDLAVRLGQVLARRVEFVEVQWEDQIPALVAGRTDIIMSGMSITQARQVRIAFTEPYLETGLSAAFRPADAARFSTREGLLGALAKVGTVAGTTGDVFVQREFPGAQRTAFARASDGALGVRRYTVDVLVHDFPAIAWLVSENEAELAYFRGLLTRESLAWAIRRNDAELLSRVNAALQAWRADGSLDAAIRRWIPYWQRG